MEFLKRHYEKLILIVVLLCLVGVAVWLPMSLAQARADLNKETPVSHPKPMEPMSLAEEMAALAQVTNPPPVVLSGDHNVFNPVTWKRKLDGTLMKILKVGPDALLLTNTTPLYTTIGYDHGSDVGCYIWYQKSSGQKHSEFSKKDEKAKSGLYTIRGIQGAADNPTELELELPDQSKPVAVSPGKPIQWVDSYTADFFYPPESQAYTRRHVNDLIYMDGQPYKIVAITNNAARLQDTLTEKQTTIIWSPSSTNAAPPPR